MSLWFEKYRPTNLDEMIVSDTKMAVLDKWFTDFKAGTNDKCALLFTGPPGLGKTSLAHVILKRHGYEVKEFNATDIRSRSLVNENLDSLINFTNVNRISAQRDVITGIVMDEVDGMFKGDRGGIVELLSFISMPTTRNKKQPIRRRVPIICICNIGNVKRDIIKQLQKECTEISFTLPDSFQMQRAVDRICTAEGITIENKGVTDQIIVFAQGDFRRLISVLEFLSVNHGRNITAEHVGLTCNMIAKKDKDLHITDNIKRILNDIYSCDVIAGIYNGDKSKVPMVVHQNYVPAINIQKTTYGHKMASIKKCIDSLVVSDMLEKVMYTTQSWNLQMQHGLTCTFIPNYYINKYPKQQAANSSWASILSICSQSQNLKKNLYEIIYRIPGRRSYTIQDVQLLVEYVLHHIIIGNYEKAIQVVQQYNICDLADFKGKKCIAVFDKLIKFIKISTYLDKWAQFKEDSKQNKALDSTIRAFIEKCNTKELKMTTVICQSPRKLSPIPNDEPKPKLKLKLKVGPGVYPPLPAEQQPLPKKKIVFKKKAI